MAGDCGRARCCCSTGLDGSTVRSVLWDSGTRGVWEAERSCWRTVRGRWASGLTVSVFEFELGLALGSVGSEVLGGELRRMPESRELNRARVDLKRSGATLPKLNNYKL